METGLLFFRIPGLRDDFFKRGFTTAVLKRARAEGVVDDGCTHTHAHTRTYTHAHTHTHTIFETAGKKRGRRGEGPDHTFSR